MKRKQKKYSLFYGTLKTLKSDLSNLLANGTDDEEALSSAFTENFERMTHLLCSNHLQKNVENWLVKLCVTGKEKESIVPDIFSWQIGDIYERGLCDAEIPKQFCSQMKVVKEKCTRKGPKGLDCPPLKFTMNRLELTNGVIQDHIKQRFGQCQVDVFSFSVALKELINMQEKEVELSVVGKGKYVIRLH